MSIKEELFKVYYSRISDFQHIQDVCSVNSAPCLMSPNENYSKQPFPFLAVGQNTSGWEGKISSGWGWDSPGPDEFTEEDLTGLMTLYEDFKSGINYYSSPFWNIIRKIETTLGNTPYSCAHTNISKYDQNNGKPDKEREKHFSILDNLLIDEIRIIKPAICIFFTGHDFDYRLKNIFGQIEFLYADDYEIHELCQLKHPLLPVLTYRTYHQNYLRMRKMEESVIDFIREQIEK